MVVDTANALSNLGKTTPVVTTPIVMVAANTKNPKTEDNSVLPISIISILSVTALTVVSKKRKFKVVKKG